MLNVLSYNTTGNTSWDGVFHITGYDDSSPNALIIEGLLGSLSAGILVYMALVDLISLDFFHNKMMTSSIKLKRNLSQIPSRCIPPPTNAYLQTHTPPLVDLK